MIIGAQHIGKHKRPTLLALGIILHCFNSNYFAIAAPRASRMILLNMFLTFRFERRSSESVPAQTIFSEYF